MSKLNKILSIGLFTSLLHLVFSYKTKIVGGSKGNIKDYPYMAAIVTTQADDDYTDCNCGATIVTPLWILTAGHCCFLYDQKLNPKKWSAIVGSTRCYDLLRETYQKIRLAELIVHPNYNIRGDEEAYTFNDIAMIRLEKKINMKLGIRPVKLLLKQQLGGKKIDEVYKSCKAIGWGTQSQSTSYSPPELYAVQLPLISIEDCRYRYSGNFKGVQRILFNKFKAMCTLENKGGKDVCSGDSGGPLMCDDIQVAIVSMSPACGDPELPNIWTRVDYYHSWILQTITKSTKTKHIRLFVNKSLRNMFSPFVVIISGIVWICGEIE